MYEVSNFIYTERICTSGHVGTERSHRIKSVNAWAPWVDIASKESKRSQISTIVDLWEYIGKESSMVEECKEER